MPKKDTSAIFAAASKDAPTEAESQQNKASIAAQNLAQHHQNRDLVKNIYNTKFKAILTALKGMEDAKGNKFHVMISEGNMKPEESIVDEGTYYAPKISIGIACATSRPYGFEHKKKHPTMLKETLKEYTSHTTYNSKTTHDVNLDLNGLFTTGAKGTISERGEKETTYHTRPAIGIFISPDNIEVVRFDKKRPLTGDMIWDFSNFYGASIATEKAETTLPEFAEWIIQNSELSQEDLAELNHVFANPDSLSTIDTIKYTLRSWGLG